MVSEKSGEPLVDHSLPARESVNDEVTDPPPTGARQRRAIAASAMVATFPSTLATASPTRARVAAEAATGDAAAPTITAPRIPSPLSHRIPAIVPLWPRPDGG